MKKIGIVTQYGNSNYGNRLQNYAVQKLIEKEGYVAETIVCKKFGGKEILKSLRSIAMTVLRKKKYIRQFHFQKFNKKYINRFIIYTKNGLIPDEVSNRYEYIVTGSDQVWNPDTRVNEKDNFLLRFCGRSQRIAIAPSLGVSVFPQTCETEFQIGFDGFPFLSCREKDGSDAITKLSGRDCLTIIDPTLVLTADEWRAFAKKIHTPEKYLVFFFLGVVSEKIRKLVSEYAEQNHLQIIEPNRLSDDYYAIDPREFVWLLMNAEMVFTDSFHVTAFSINLHIPFYVFSRQQNDGVSNRMMSRLTSLLSIVNLENRLYTPTNEISSTCDFQASDEILAKEREAFMAFFHKCLRQKEIAPFLLPDQTCTGCGACSLRCPVGALEMKTDAEGFIRPHLNFDQCIQCGKCTSVCPVIKGHESKKASFALRAYAAYNKDESIVRNSSSGGVIPEFARWIIGEKGIVYGVAFDEAFEPAFIGIENIKDISRIVGSKYVQCDAYPVFSEIENHLKESRKVLFIGTPCQVAGLKAYLGKDYENLYRIDFVCHGVPSPVYWNKYLSSIRSKYLNDEGIEEVQFRYKDEWPGTKMRIRSKNREYIMNPNKDPYYEAFSKNLSLRQSCYACSFKDIKRGSDITVGDFWGLDKIMPEVCHASGNSLVMIQSDKGQALFDACAKSIQFTQVDQSLFVGKFNRAMVVSGDKHPNRRIFFNCLPNHDVYDATVKYLPIKQLSMYKRGIRKVKRLFGIY